MVLIISGVISRETIVRTQSRALITPLITTHEPPSMAEVPCSERADCRLSRSAGRSGSQHVPSRRTEKRTPGNWGL